MLKKLALVAIQGYRYFLSPLLGHHCRFYPSCSEYSQQAIGQHGLCRGGWLTMKRLLRCHPGCQGGVDLVPNHKNERESWKK